MFKIQALWSVQ